MVVQHMLIRKSHDLTRQGSVSESLQWTWARPAQLGHHSCCQHYSMQARCYSLQNASQNRQLKVALWTSCQLAAPVDPVNCIIAPGMSETQAAKCKSSHSNMVQATTACSLLANPTLGRTTWTRDRSHLASCCKHCTLTSCLQCCLIASPVLRIAPHQMLHMYSECTYKPNVPVNLCQQLNQKACQSMFHMSAYQRRWRRACSPSLSVISAAFIAFGKSCLLANTRSTASRSSSCRDKVL